MEVVAAATKRKCDLTRVILMQGVYFPRAVLRFVYFPPLLSTLQADLN